jgi:hypothetical protein
MATILTFLVYSQISLLNINDEVEDESNPFKSD